MLLKKYFIFSATVLSLILLAGCGTTSTLVNEQYDALAKHLTETGIKVYGATGCGACQKQEELFGDSWQYINYEDCHASESRQQLQICAEHDIRAYPTWEFANREQKQGVMLPEQLAEISNFS